MKNSRRYLIAAASALFIAMTAGAQSKSFKLGQWVEIQNSILKELNRSYVDSLPVDRIMRTGIDAMLDNLDPYTIYIPEEENEDLQMMLSKTYGGIGAIIYKKKDGNVVINEPYMGSPAYKNSLVCGDEIIAIDGEPTIGLEAAQSSTKARTEKKDGETGFTDNVSSDVKAGYFKLKEAGMKRLVLDLRGNGGGLMPEAINIVSLFVPRGSLVVTAKGKDQESFKEYRTTAEPIDTGIPLIIMVDSGSASSSEIVAGAIQDLDRGTIIGERTFGKGLVQSIRPIIYNGQLKVTTAKYYTPSGRCVQAIDYSHRNEDGSVGHIPDSLTHEFKTMKGRTVRDGGGITPDIKIDSPEYSRLVYSLVLSGVVDNYVLKFVREHDSIPALEDFHFTDEEFEDFITFAKTQEFDYRSSAKTLFDQMKKEIGKDGLEEEMKDELDALDKALDMDKEKFIRLKKDEIIPFIEEEIAVRYYYQEAGIQVRLRYDDQLKKALEVPSDQLIK